jgi:nucleoid-associated protein YgaU
MLDDFRQDKQDQPLDPLTEDSSLPWGKKIGLVCLVVAVIGLFVFFTSDSWNSDSKASVKKDDLAQELEQIKVRLTDLEQRIPAKPFVATESPSLSDSADQSGLNAEPAPMANLKSLIEQELQEVAVANADTSSTADKPVISSPAKTQAKAQTTTDAKTYTVKKGDTLSKIAQRFYGSSSKWRRIVEANKEKLGHSQVLKVGMTLTIPKEG